MPTKPSPKKTKKKSPDDVAFDQVLTRMLETPPDPKMATKKPKKKPPDPHGGSK